MLDNDELLNLNHIVSIKLSGNCIYFYEAKASPNRHVQTFKSAKEAKETFNHLKNHL